MICPNCGRQTEDGERCRHCHQPMEFTARAYSRPGPIPGIEEPPIRAAADRGRGGKRGGTAVLVVLCAVMAVAACVLNVICFLQIRRMRETTPPSAQTEPAEEEWGVRFDWNRQEAGPWIPMVSRGQTLPTLPDSLEYRFTGWNTAPDGTGTSFRPGEPFELAMKEELALYAQWEPISLEPPATQTEETFGLESTEQPPEQEGEQYHG